MPEEKPSRERDLILKGSPCDINYFDKTILTVGDAMKRGGDRCPAYGECNSPESSYCCVLRTGFEIAQHILRGSNLKYELKDLSKADFTGERFRNSVNRMEFRIEQGKGKFLAAAEGFARVVLLMDPFESVLLKCEQCGDVKISETVYDSIHDGPFPLSGSGKTIRRDVQYCPTCEKKPVGGFLKEDPADAREREFLRKMSERNGNG